MRTNFICEKEDEESFSFLFFKLFSGPGRRQIQSAVNGSIGRSCDSQNYIRNKSDANCGAKSAQTIKIITVTAIAKGAEINQ